MTWLVLWITDKTVGLRCERGERARGLDLGEHGETAYPAPEPSIHAALTVAVSPLEAEPVKARSVIQREPHPPARRGATMKQASAMPKDHEALLGRELAPPAITTS